LDNTIIAAAITGTAIVAGAILTAYLSNAQKERRKAKNLPEAPQQRHAALHGSWIGTMDQKVGLDAFCNAHKLSIEFSENSNPVVGTMTLEFCVTENQEHDSDRVAIAKLFNLIFDGTILKFDYVNKDSATIHFGTIYGRLSGAGKEIKGEFLGYGLISERFVSGAISLKKHK
jgi:hypothetical protein